MKSNAKQKPRVTSLSVLQSIDRTVGAIDRKVGAISKFVQPSDAPLQFGVEVGSPISYPLAPTLIKLAPNGERLPETFKGEHHGVLIPGVLPKQDLLIDARKPDKAPTWQRAVEMGAAIDLYGTKAELWLPEHAQLIIRRDLREPACDKNFFPHMPTSDWCWTRTELKSNASSPSGVAWYVSFYCGNVDWGNQYVSGFVVGSRLVPAGQF